MTVPGDVLVGRYRLVRSVATGGMGSVWEAWDQLLQRRVAIKELLPQPGLSEEDFTMTRSRVIREARITARLHHPHAVTLYDVVDHGGQPCLILQYVPSRTLSSILAEQGLLQVAFVVGVGAEVASALAAAHQVGVIHRDVKPSNVLITPTGAAMITDFGISHAAGDVSLTSTGMVTGTPAFLAPEVARGAPSGFPADVFSLGATLYAALEGTPPFGTDQNPMAILHKVASGQIIPPRRSGGLTSLLVQMLATDPAARPAMSTVARLLTDLQRQRSDPGPAPAPPTIAVPPRTIRAWPADSDQGAGPAAAPAVGVAAAASRPTHGSRRRRMWAVLTAATVVLAALGAFVVIGGRRGVQPSADQPVNVPASVARSSGAGSAPQRISTTTPRPPASTTPAQRTSSSAARPTASSSRPPAITSAAPPTSPPLTPTPSSTKATKASKASKASTSASDPARPTSAQLAAAITDYYALLPGDTDQGWARLTTKFQKGTAQNRQYYQRFWDSVERVTATDTHGASPDTAEAKVTYHFKDGRTAVELTVYSLVPQGGILMIDSSTVLSSTVQ